MTSDRAWRSGLSRFVGRSMRYALADAMNATLEAGQREQRAGMRKRFTIRRAGFADRSVKIPAGGFARASKLVAELRIAGPMGRSGDNPFAAFEQNRTKTPSSGGKRIAIPLDIRSNRADVIRKADRPRALLAAASENGRAWIHEKGDGTALLYRVKGRGKNATVQIAYVLKPSAPVRKRLELVPTIRRVFEREIANKVRAAIVLEAATFRVGS